MTHLAVECLAGHRCDTNHPLKKKKPTEMLKSNAESKKQPHVPGAVQRKHHLPLVIVRTGQKARGRPKES